MNYSIFKKQLRYVQRFLNTKKSDEQLNHMPRVAIGIRYTSAFL